MKRWIVGIGVPVMLLGISFVLYDGAVTHQRIGDEGELVWSNPAVNGTSWTQMLAGRWQEGEFRPQARPVATTVRWIEHLFYDFERGKYQLDQILLHGLAAILLFVLLRRWLRSEVAGFLGALVFVVHPGLSQSVLYLGGLSEILSTAFCLLCLISLRTDGKPGRGRLVAVGLFALLSMLSKEIGFLVPLIGWGILLASGRAARGRRSYAYALLAAFVVGIAYRITALASLPGSVRLIPAVDPTTARPLPHLLLQSIAGILMEIRVILLPTTLSPDYSWLLILHGPRLFLFAGGGLLLVLLGAVVLRWRPIRPERTGLVLLAFLPLLAAALTPITTGSVASERNLYLALTGWCGLLGLAGTKVAAWRRDLAPILSGVAVGIAALLGVRTFVRVPDFASDEQLLISARQSYPENPQIIYEQGNQQLSEGDFAGAQSLYEEALKLRPDFPICSVNLATAYLGQNQYGLALRVLDPVAQKAMHHRALRMIDAKAHYHAGLVLMQQARYKEAAEAFERTLLFYPDHLGARGNLGLIYVKAPPYAERGIRILKEVIPLESNPERRATLQRAVDEAEDLLQEYVRQRGALPSKLEPAAKAPLGEPWRTAAEQGL